MIYRDRSIKKGQRVYSQIILRPPQRLNFPVKQLTQGYVGKKQFPIKNQDKVVFEWAGLQSYIRKDKLDVRDIQGAKPKIKTEAIQNVQKYYRYNPQQQSSKGGRIKTEGQDSLDTYIRNMNEISQVDKRKKSIYKINKNNQINFGIEKYLSERNMQLTKKNILGISDTKFLDNRLQRKPRIEQILNKI